MTAATRLGSERRITDRDTDPGEVVLAAARWLVENREKLRRSGRRAIPVLQDQFGLSCRQAVEAIRHANAAEFSERG